MFKKKCCKGVDNNRSGLNQSQFKRLCYGATVLVSLQYLYTLSMR